MSQSIPGAGFSIGGTWNKYKLAELNWRKWLQNEARNLIQRRGYSKPEEYFAQAGLDWNTIGYVRQLETLADTIIELGGPDDIPTVQQRTLRYVVDLRKKTARFFARVADDSQDENLKQKHQLSQQTHQHLIDVLDGIWNKFRACLMSGSSTANPPGPGGVPNLTSAFAALEVERGKESNGENTEEERPPQTAKSPKTKSQGQKAKKARKGKKDGEAKAAKNKQHDSFDWGSLDVLAPDLAESSFELTSWVDKDGKPFPPFMPWDDKWHEDMHLFYMECINAIAIRDHPGHPDLFLMWYCFFNDLNTISNHVRQRWEHVFNAEKPSKNPNTLAIITNAACEMFQQLEIELHDALDEFCPSKMVRYDYISHLLVCSGSLKHVNYDTVPALDTPEGVEQWFEEQGDFVGLLTFRDLREMLGNKAYEPGIERSWDSFAGADFKKTTEGSFPELYVSGSKREVQVESRRVLMEVGADLCILKRSTHGPSNKINFIPAESQILLELRKAVARPQKLRASTIFAIQLYSEIRWILKRKVEAAFEQLQDTAHRVVDTIDNHFRFGKIGSCEMPSTPAKGGAYYDLCRELTALKTDINDWMQTDILCEHRRYEQGMMKASLSPVVDALKTKVEKSEDSLPTVEADPPKFDVLKNEPVYAGLLELRAKLAISEKGSLLCSLYPVVEAAAYIYAAARAASTQNDETRIAAWPDLDRYIEMFTESRGFRAGMNYEQLDALTILSKWEAERTKLAGKQDLKGEKKDSEGGKKASEAEKKDSEAKKKDSEAGKKDSEAEKKDSEARKKASEAEKKELRAQKKLLKAAYRRQLKARQALLERYDTREKVFRAHDTKVGANARVKFDKAKVSLDEATTQLSYCNEFLESNPAKDQTQVRLLEDIEEKVGELERDLLTMDYFKLFQECAEFLTDFIRPFELTEWYSPVRPPVDQIVTMPTLIAERLTAATEGRKQELLDTLVICVQAHVSCL